MMFMLFGPPTCPPPPEPPPQPVVDPASEERCAKIRRILAERALVEAEYATRMMGA